MFRIAAVVLLVSVPAACGDGETVPPRKPKSGDPVRETAMGQEVWIPYKHASHTEHLGNVILPDRERARKLIDEQHAAVSRGGDIGDAAFNNSLAPGGFVGGFSGLLPRDRQSPDDRDRAMLTLPEGELSDIVEWNHGFWFGTPLADVDAQVYQRRFEHAAEIRARARLIHVHYAWAHPRRVQFDGFSKEQAIQAAKRYIARIRAGEDFAELAAEVSNDEDSSRRGGLMMQPPLEPGGKPTEWIQWRSAKRWYRYPIFEAVLETAPVGEVMPEPLVSRYGVDVILVLEREGP